jgi:exodeoxyribonuclease V alpha subunit
MFANAQADPSPLAQALVGALPRLCGGDSPVSSATATTLAELIGSLAAALEQGELELALDGPAPEGIDPQGWPERHRQALAASPLAVQASELERLPEAPLVWSGYRLRWRRWHLQLEACLGQLTARALAPLAPALDKTAVDQAVASAAAQGLDPQQQQAVAALLRHGLVLLGGGPGTGKTSTVVQMLGARLALQPELRLHLAAPTGKAAARLRTTLQEGSQRLAGPLAERLAQAPCTTLHRLLESSGERFGRNRRHPLALDLLVVDELSMVDLPLMAALLEALPLSCQLLLVGDPAQLPPVGPGAVLQELGQPTRLAALGEAAIELKTTYRNNGAIAAFAALLRPGTGDGLLRPAEQAPGVGAATPTFPGSAPIGTETGVAQAEALMTHLDSLGPEDNLIWQRHPAVRLPAPALERLRRHQQRLQALAEAIDWGTGTASTGGEGEPLANTPSQGAPTPSPARSDPPSAAKPLPEPDPEAIAALLAELEACVLLSPVRQGAWGVEAVQRQLLGEAADKAIQHWPLGTPVLCQRNLADEGLANGDIGVLVERAGERLVLFAGPFPGPTGATPGSSIPQARLFHPARLGAAEPALALTIHKSQGSQYQEVVLLVPQTRHWDPRLLYTGLTRARHRAWLITTTAPSWLLAD